MQIEEEIRSLRAALEPTLNVCGHPVADLDDEQFTGRLRHCLMTLTGGPDAVGFDCASTKTAAGDYLVTLVWSDEANKLQPKTSVGFTAYGPTETLAFLRAAQKTLKHAEYRDLLFRSSKLT
jgi:hypothetical protein